MRKILIAEISGKRPGTKAQRTTEKLLEHSEFDKVIVSNNSEGYETDLPIVNVPEDFRRDYIARNVPEGGRAYYAPMNRTYAIQYAKELGYDYLVQLDDNIIYLDISFTRSDGRMFRNQAVPLDPWIKILAAVLDNSNAFMAGGGMSSSGQPLHTFLAERYCYSAFMLNLETCPQDFWGDFEDDIEFRLKGAQMGLPCLMCCPLKYEKLGQHHSGDTSGCRAEYNRAGMHRGDKMRILYGDKFAVTNARKHGVTTKCTGYKHIIAPFKVSAIVNLPAIKKSFAEIVSTLPNRARHTVEKTAK